MYTGEGYPYKRATIQSFNGVEEMYHWNGSECNKVIILKAKTNHDKTKQVHGSDGAAFNPNIKKSDTLWFFNDQLCRAMPLVYAQTVQHKGLPGLRSAILTITNHHHW